MVCERAFLAALDGSCRTPIAGWARKDGDKLAFTGLVGTVDGKKRYETTRTGALTEADAVAIGHDAGAQLKAEAKADGTVFDWA